ncbi:cellulose binding domain-containing protein [Sphaerisporangium corydalis]|uniref:Cellulose binding domain-containing protein n=1 Tax=Sphaerisporangium corydalis TaxID=1441875 RepID=A0ABV9EP56_9ACTN|nr:cellulose binding domain-containing protein [Sphaerisporangium corydalis]
MRRRLVYALLAALVALAGLVVTMPALSAAVVASPASSAAAPVRIMPLGDSITGGPGCWRALLWDRLQRTGFTNIDFVGTLPGGGCSVAHDGDNEGHGGFLATGIANQDQLPPWLAATRPDIVLMHLGTNDVWNNLPTASILAAYGKLVDQMRASNAGMKIVVARIIPMTPSGCTWCPSGVAALDDAIPGWAAGKTTAQSPITVVDQFTGFDTVADTNGDGVHPDDSGFQKMSDRWYPALTPLLGGAPPTDTTAPTVPAGLTVTVGCPAKVTLNWTASTDNVGVTGYDVYRSSNSGPFTSVGTTTTTSFTEPLAGVYRYEVRARDAAGNASAFTAPVTAAPPPCPTNPPQDTRPPTAPGTPTASVTCGSVRLTWAASTDDVGVTGYDIWRAPGTTGGTFVSAGTSATTSFTQSGAGTFRYQIRARDAAGNTSSFSSAVTVTVTACPGTGACTAVYSQVGGWPGAFQGQVTVTNTGTTTTTGWTVTLTFSSGQRITQIWGARTDGTASPYVIANESYNGTLAPAAATTFGFLASGTGDPPTATCVRTP